MYAGPEVRFQRRIARSELIRMATTNIKMLQLIIDGKFNQPRGRNQSATVGQAELHPALACCCIVCKCFATLLHNRGPSKFTAANQTQAKQVVTPFVSVDIPIP